MASSSPNGLFALVIGIDDYAPETGFDKLMGAVSDADRIRSWLIKDLGVPLSQIRNLRDNAATRKVIIQALEDLSTDARIQFDDPILIYYAGHGSEAPAPKQWRWDSARIQMIVPWDFGQSDGHTSTIQGIPDRTLGVLFAKLAERKGNNITVIFDCCHSGSGTRSRDDTTRVRGGPYHGQLPADLDDDIVLFGTQGTRVPDKIRHHGIRSHVLLVAYSPHELAYETNSSGAFTRALLRALHGTNTAELTYRSLIERMEPLRGQTPQCEGYYQGRFLFNRKVASTKPLLHATLKGGKLTIANAGAAHGITIGSKFAIWASPNDQNADPLTTVAVETVRAFDSIATFMTTKVNSRSFVAQIQENPKPELVIYVPDNIKIMGCFKNLFSDGRPPLRIAVTEDKFLATIGLTFLDEYDEIGFEMLIPEEQKQKIRYSIEASPDDLHAALDHFCAFFDRRDRVKRGSPTMGEDRMLSSPNFTVEIFRLELNYYEDYQGLLNPAGPNLNIQGTGIQLVVGPHNEDDFYGFRINNSTDQRVFPYLFYFDSADFSISTYYLSPDAGIFASANTAGKGPSIGGAFDEDTVKFL
ncbi:hypothetical protein MD484_g5508, partial [Candolleomyces efflorescens]